MARSLRALHRAHYYTPAAPPRQPLFSRAHLHSKATFTAFMVVVRLLSGVHWATDIIGGTLLSVSLLALLSALI